MTKKKKKKSFLKTLVKATIVFLFIFLAIGFYVDNKSYNETFVLLGVDSRDFNEKKNVRSDTIMIVNLDRQTGKINLISVPRDTKTPIEGRKNEERINHSFAYGGPELALKTISNLIGKDIENYVVVDYKLVREYVDLIGGVEIDVPMDMYYSDPTDDPPLLIDLKKGLQVLDGDNAISFLRFRKGYKNADLGRIDAQQKFIQAMVTQSLKPKNLIKIPSMYKLYKTHVDTNISFSKALSMGLGIYNFDKDNIEKNIVPGIPKTIKGTSYYIHDPQRTNEMINAIIK